MRTLLVVLGLASAGLCGGIGARLLLPPVERHPEPAGTTARIEARLVDLEAEVARLREERLHERIAPVVAARDAVPPPEDGPAPAAPDAEASEGEVAVAGVSDAYIEEKIRRVLTRRAQEEKDAIARQKAVYQAEKDDRFLKDLQEKLDLTDFQRDELGRHLKDRRDALEIYKRKLVARGEDIDPTEREALRQELTDFVRQQDEELRKLLGVDTFDRLMEITSPPQKK